MVQKYNSGVSRLTASAFELHANSLVENFANTTGDSFSWISSVPLPPSSKSCGHYSEGLVPRDYPHQYFPLSPSPMFPSTATLLATLATVEHKRFAAGSTIPAPLSASTIYCHVGSVQQSHSRSAQTGTLPEHVVAGILVLTRNNTTVVNPQH